MTSGRSRLFVTLLPALLGAAAGYGYGFWVLGLDGAFPPLYGAMGGVAGVLAVRLFGLFKAILSDFLSKD